MQLVPSNFEIMPWKITRAITDLLGRTEIIREHLVER